MGIVTVAEKQRVLSHQDERTDEGGGHQGVFDPRTYKQEDKQNWARKRKPEWMATTGQIHFVRERTVASQEREVEEERRAQAARDEASQDLKAAVQEDPA